MNNDVNDDNNYDGYDKDHMNYFWKLNPHIKTKDVLILSENLYWTLRECDDPTAAEYFLDKGADPNFIHMSDGLSTLLRIILSGNFEKVKLLIDRGVKVTPKDVAAAQEGVNLVNDQSVGKYHRDMAKAALPVRSKILKYVTEAYDKQNVV